jgi:transcriptional regulator with XRE-family HTH domain
LRNGAISGYNGSGQKGLNAVVCEHDGAFSEPICRLWDGVAPNSRSDISPQSWQGQPMTGGSSDGHLDRLVKAAWLKIGLTQADLAEALDAVRQPPRDHDGDAAPVGLERLQEIGHALDIPIDAFRPRGPGTEQPESDHASVDLSLSVLSLLELRLLRAFCQLRDHRTKRLLIRLAEQIVKRQGEPGGDAA